MIQSAKEFIKYLFETRLLDSEKVDLVISRDKEMLRWVLEVLTCGNELSFSDDQIDNIEDRLDSVLRDIEEVAKEMEDGGWDT